jgi:hypothetical protein
MIFRTILFAFVLANCSLAADRHSCPVTTPSDPLFVPPAPYSSSVHVHSGGKLPFFRQGYDWRKDERPRLTVVARRLDVLLGDRRPLRR